MCILSVFGAPKPHGFFFGAGVPITTYSAYTPYVSSYVVPSYISPYSYGVGGLGN